jgi:hypothetical protein
MLAVVLAATMAPTACSQEAVMTCTMARATTRSARLTSTPAEIMAMVSMARGVTMIKWICAGMDQMGQVRSIGLELDQI